MKALKEARPLPLGSISNRRSLVYLGNLVDALAVCCRDPRAAGHTFLMSDGEDVSTPELMRMVASALGAPARLFPFPISLMCLAGRLTGRSAQVRRLTGSLAVDSSKIRRVLNWQPPYTLAAGLKDTAGWYLATHGGAP
jgi:UDP-glucose 4-epimerase